MADWLSRTQEGVLQTGKAYLTILNEDTKDSEGKPCKKYEVWGIPEAVVKDLGVKYAAAAEAYALARSPETSTPVTNEGAARAIDELKAVLRMIKRRFGHRPPMDNLSFVALGWKIPGSHARPVGVSGTVPNGVVSNPILHIIRLMIVPVDAALFDRKTAALVCVRWGILDPDKEGRSYIKKIPVGPDDLPEQEDRRLRIEEWEFDAADAGKKVYFCMRYVNVKGEHGSWGPILSAVIT